MVCTVFGKMKQKDFLFKMLEDKNRETDLKQVNIRCDESICFEALSGQYLSNILRCFVCHVFGDIILRL